MKTILLTLFVVTVSAVPLSKDNDGVEMTMNEVPDGTALEADDIEVRKQKEHTTGIVVSTDLLHPSTAVGIAESHAAVTKETEASVIDKDITITPKLHPTPEVINPKPAVELTQAILEPKPEQLPVAAAHFNGQVPNDGLVKVQYNGPEEPGMMSTLQEWFKMLVEYFNSTNKPAAPSAPLAPIPPVVHHHKHNI
ncbi:hypothetical protein PYW08_005755 [Mythimna loreyi]|uniref:Uncharacterized protein n=1 Tax=Mythimna loreyi TaxID=667449 RepID=A0ACC2QIP1_9NEOP|nr:hypothetical protein PYW08_005755 [Mythimna loreyi]